MSLTVINIILAVGWIVGTWMVVNGLVSMLWPLITKLHHHMRAGYRKLEFTGKPIVNDEEEPNSLLQQGMEVLSRPDCPPDTVYMVNDAVALQCKHYDAVSVPQHDDIGLFYFHDCPTCGKTWKTRPANSYRRTRRTQGNTP